MAKQIPARRLYGIAVDWSALLRGIAKLRVFFKNARNGAMWTWLAGACLLVYGASSCVAGWYLREAFVTEHVPRKYRGKLDFSDDFAHGSYALCCDLGFDWLRRPSPARDKTPVDIAEDFFRENGDLWGNGYGDKMFDEARAFGKGDGESFVVKDILQHWRGVRSRIYSAK